MEPWFPNETFPFFLFLKILNDIKTVAFDVKKSQNFVIFLLNSVFLILIVVLQWAFLCSEFHIEKFVNSCDCSLSVFMFYINNVMVLCILDMAPALSEATSMEATLTILSPATYYWSSQSYPCFIVSISHHSLIIHASKLVKQALNPEDGTSGTPVKFLHHDSLLGHSKNKQLITCCFNADPNLRTLP